MKKDADGLTRVNLEWKIEGKKIHGTRSGTLYELHEQEVAAATAQIKREARRGDTVTIRLV